MSQRNGFRSNGAQRLSTQMLESEFNVDRKKVSRYGVGGGIPND